MRTTLIYRLIARRIRQRLLAADVDVEVAPYAGQDRPGVNGEPLVTLPKVLIRIEVGGTPIRQLGRGLELCPVRIEAICLGKMIGSQDERLMGPEQQVEAVQPGAYELARLVQIALSGYSPRKSDLPELAGAPNAGTYITSTLTRTSQQDGVAFGSVQRVAHIYQAVTKDPDGLLAYQLAEQPQEGWNVSINTTLTEL